MKLYRDRQVVFVFFDGIDVIVNVAFLVHYPVEDLLVVDHGVIDQQICFLVFLGYARGSIIDLIGHGVFDRFEYIAESRVILVLIKELREFVFVVVSVLHEIDDVVDIAVEQSLSIFISGLEYGLLVASEYGASAEREYHRPCKNG